MAAHPDLPADWAPWIARAPRRAMSHERTWSLAWTVEDLRFRVLYGLPAEGYTMPWRFGFGLSVALTRSSHNQLHARRAKRGRGD